MSIDITLDTHHTSNNAVEPGRKAALALTGTLLLLDLLEPLDGGGARKLVLLGGIERALGVALGELRGLDLWEEEVCGAASVFVAECEHDIAGALCDNKEEER